MVVGGYFPTRFWGYCWKTRLLVEYGAVERITKKQFHMAQLKRILKRLVEVEVLGGQGLEQEQVVWSEVVLQRGG